MTALPQPDPMPPSGRGRRRLRQAVLGLGRPLRVGFGLAALLGAALAWGDEVPEYRVKAAFLFNFASYTEWPAEVGGVLNLCVPGPDPFAGELDALNGKPVGSRTIAVHRKAAGESLKACQIVFVPAASIGQLPRLLESVRGQPVLFVADSPGAIRQGVALNMNVARDRVTFEANLDAARNARINLSSRLLRLATDVIR